MPAVFVTRPVRSIEDLGAAIIAAVYGAGASEAASVMAGTIPGQDPNGNRVHTN